MRSNQDPSLSPLTLAIYNGCICYATDVSLHSSSARPFRDRPYELRRRHRSVMAVMEIRDVRMVVLESRVIVAVGVGLTRGVLRQVKVPMMFIVHVTVIVRHGLVSVLVSVVFTQ